MGGVPVQPGASGAPPSQAEAQPTVLTWGGASCVVRHEAVQKSDFYRALEAEEVQQEKGEALQSDAPPAAEQPAADAPAPDAPLSLEAAAASLEGRVRYWTDYLKAPLHTRTPLLLHAAWGDAAAMDGFGDTRGFTEGVAAEEAHERVRCAPEFLPHSSQGLSPLHGEGTLRRSATRWRASTCLRRTAARSAR